MINHDQMFDFIRSKIDQVLFEESNQKAILEYFQAKTIQRMMIEELRLPNQHEQLLYDILELCLFLSDEEINYSTAEQLSHVLAIDPELRIYCEHHVLGDGIWAKLKYEIPIKLKKKLIAEALENLN
jgi:hypothetical protein